jgi:sec-independent protein translocase protein TatC
MAELTFTQHLDELRTRALWSAAIFLSAAVIAFSFAPQMLDLIKMPAGYLGKLKFFQPSDAFTIHVRLALLGGFLLSSPFLFYQLWAFVAPAISQNARRYIVIFIAAMLLSFAAGCSFAYFILIPPALKFLVSFGHDQLEYIPSASAYVSFTIMLMFYCGLIFLLPVFTWTFSKLGLLTPKTLTRQWKVIAVVIVIAAAVITPTSDVFNMAMMAMPMFLLYGVSIIVSFLAK